MNFPIYQLKKNEFPPLLKEINDPPEKLYIRGNLPSSDFTYLSVVGSRKYTSYGKDACEKIIAGLRGYKVVIVSGLALGIDAIAHRSALLAGLPTIAVPGSGIDPKILYPSANRNLAEKILESGGAVLSEFEPDFKATLWSFPQRNRIMAGLSKAVLIVEAEIKSGTLITSKLATEYNRDVLTIPGSIFSKNSEGPHMLIKLGATPVTKSEDVLEALGFKSEKQELPFEEKYKDCSPLEMKIVGILSEPKNKDELIRTLGIPTQEAQSIISLMEIKGLIKESLGEISLI